MFGSQTNGKPSPPREEDYKADFAIIQALGADPNGIAMKRVVNFYEKLPRGPAPEVKATGILGRYQAKHFGKNPSAKRTSYKASSASPPPWISEHIPCTDAVII